MTRLYLRTVRVQVDSGSTRSELDSALDVDFTVRRNLAKAVNESRIRIKNLGPTTRNAIKAGAATLRLFAGYDTQTPPLLAQGQVVRAITSWNPPDSVTEITLGDGATTLSAALSLSYTKGATVGQLLQEVAQKLGVPLQMDNFNEGESFPSGFTFSGKANRGLDQITRRANARWSLQNGVLFVYGGNFTRAPILDLSADTGLVAVPEELESNVVSGRVLQAQNPKRGFRVESFLLPTLTPGDRINLTSRTANGTFYIDELEHSGGNRQDEMRTRLTLYDR